MANASDDPPSRTAGEILSPWARPIGYGAGCGLAAALALLVNSVPIAFLALPALYTADLQRDVVRAVAGVQIPREPLVVLHAAIQGAIAGAVLHLVLRRRRLAVVERCRALGRRFPWAAPALAGAGLALGCVHALELPREGMGVWHRGSTGDYACDYGGSLHWRACPRPGRPPCPYRPRWREVLALPTVLPGKVLAWVRPRTLEGEYLLLVGLALLEGALAGVAVARLARVVRCEHLRGDGAGRAARGP